MSKIEKVPRTYVSHLSIYTYTRKQTYMHACGREHPHTDTRTLSMASSGDDNERQSDRQPGRRDLAQ